MTKRFNYVILSQQSWNTKIGSNAKDIALEISKENIVLYVNRPLDLKTRIKALGTNALKRARTPFTSNGIASQIEEVKENLFAFTPKCTLLSINKLPEGPVYDWALHYNNRLLAREVRKAIDYLKIEKYAMINDGELFNGYYLNEMLDAQKSLYYYRDYFLAVPYWQKHGTRMEPCIFAKYDAVVCNSEYLTDIAKEHNFNSIFVGQGCDYSLLQNTSTERKICFSTDEKPIIGYVGALNSQRLDVPLLEQLALRNPQWQWVFVGPEDEAFQESVLHNLSNVIFTGPKPQEELALYIDAFDVAINPQVLNEVTIGNYPRKIDEYLFMGKATVATKTRAMDMFADHCLLTAGVDGYESAIYAALQSDSPELKQKRIEFASLHSWENSVHKIYQAIAS